MRRLLPPRRFWRYALLLGTFLAAGWWFAGWQTDGDDWREVTARYPVCGQDRVPRGPAPRGCVIDGDTLAIGFGKDARRIRLTGFDAPELDGACPAERAKAALARTTLSRWLSAGPFLLDGGAEPPRDRYGRELRSARRITADGSEEWLADAMVDAGLAREDSWETPAGWCPA
ncbi:hypothetical protein HME9302_00148 [Alteripontixanthobacter maritimus]|uniref:TNase-like domain-containing protein n=1 Tax=Alteripontixanthobacter maritimus TaxID=2161824 RepID=A0A369Q237_9SPHN|nr:thermonuclease family protein [Alteripontixanthobacter maritimus]RDC58971.1 hypothetical protein HME9302_00148 [Alteripontixanthobacter maritimus]